MDTHWVQHQDVSLHVVTAGDASNPPVLFLHGFPDCHKTWRRQFEALSSRYYVIAFDMRGVGKSSPSQQRKAYRIERLCEDIDAVLDAIIGKHASAHLVAHDWGSVVAWSYISERRYQSRVLSYTSLSGPHMGLMMDWAKRHLLSGNPRLMRQALTQLGSSWYVYFINVPKLPELSLKYLGRPVWQEVLKRNGVPEDDDYLNISQQELMDICLNAADLYRQNPWSPPPVPEPGSIHIPVQLIIPELDPFISSELYYYYDEYVVNLERHAIQASHWAQHSHSDEVNHLIDDFIQQSEHKRIGSAA